jgi:hypothetical protein
VIAAGLCTAAAFGHGRGHEPRPPRVPEEIRVPEGNVLDFRATGVGTQIYVWTVDSADPSLSRWVFKAPHALLFGRPAEVVGIHFGGPTWQSVDGSSVAAALVDSVPAPDPDAVPWLLLQFTSTQGVGEMTGITYIHRINTHGGLAPSAPGSVPGEEVLVPYVADYYFYRAKS